MTKKRPNHPTVQDVLERPWCFYCERDFDDYRVLVNHQKAKHFKCDRCNRRLNSAGGLSVHMTQVHKESLNKIENALAWRESPSVEIFGMEGIPEDIKQQHEQNVIAKFYQDEAERRQRTGNPPPGANGNVEGAKRPKLESKEDLKKKLAEHKARKEAERRAAEVGAGTGASPTNEMATGYNDPQQSMMYPQQSQAYGGYGQAQQYYPGYNYPTQGTPPAQLPFQPPAAYGAGSPPFAQSGYQMPPTQVSAPGLPQTMTPPVPMHSTTLPAAPGLPQRPLFNAPEMNAATLKAMHQGQMPAEVPANGQDSTAAQVDDLISSAAEAAKNTEDNKGAGVAPPATQVTEAAPKKKKVEKPFRLVYSDADLSPEEKMARLPKYAYTPNRNKQRTALGHVEGAVTGVVDA